MVNGKIGQENIFSSKILGRTSMEDFMEGNEMNFEEFEAQTLHDDYSEELWKDRQKRRGHYWKIEDEEEEEE